MTEDELRRRYESEIPMYRAWGNHVTHTVSAALRKTLGTEEEVKAFLKVPPQPRVKEVPSLISKAFYRGKEYEDPYREIADKVGTRFVVLLDSDLRRVCEIIEDNAKWRWSKDRDFDDERVSKPTTFEYQSVHYVVRCSGGLNVDGIEVADGTPCEIQVRTLLQHAYSELTHDRIYKPESNVPADVTRSVARGMALIETTDGIFSQVDGMLKAATKEIRDYLADLRGLYLADVGSGRPEEYDEKVNLYLIEHYLERDMQVTRDVLDTFYSDHGSIISLIRRKQGTSLLFSQPVILLLLYLIIKKRFVFHNTWPLTPREAAPLFEALGMNPD